ncbi:hypothetical protein FBR05_14650 [Deltaproteobacteria bacterium PRO3]|nr:hypothetical protein [Deltaproteobacteria bacterium PRO3]
MAAAPGSAAGASPPDPLSSLEPPPSAKPPGAPPSPVIPEQAARPPRPKASVITRVRMRKGLKINGSSWEMGTADFTGRCLGRQCPIA